ncbi:MAG: dual specificity protein phosphatase 23 [Planctomycetota bacterium]
MRRIENRLNFSFIIPGRLAGMSRPGQASALRDDLEFLLRKNVGAIVSLTETPLPSDAINEFGFDVLHLPVPDFTAPTADQINQFVSFLSGWDSDANGAVAVHCNAGCGRTGVLLACALVSTGKTAADAIRTVRRKRPCSIETAEQERAVRQYDARRRGTA